jgi:hypothetical protein
MARRKPMFRLLVTLASLSVGALLMGCVIVNRESEVHHHGPSEEAVADVPLEDAPGP